MQKISHILIACLLSAAPLVAQQPAAPDLDPMVRAGVLPNGLRYYVRANAKPANRAEFRLIVNAGSLQEDNDQLGIAHFLEHMAFNGTKNFPKKKLIDFLERTGMTFGAHLNASTNFDVTSYQVTLPTDQPKHLDTALQILDDWARNVTLDPKEIELERGVVLAEWRQRLGVQDRIMQQQLPFTFQGSKYAERLPIGSPTIIQTASPEVIRRFYRDWYRPDLMAVIVVGAFDAAEMEAKIKARFASLRNPASPRPRVVERVPIKDAPTISVVRDPEITTKTVMLGFRDTAITGYTPQAERARMIRNMADVLLNARLAEIVTRPDAPFQGARIDWSSVTRFETMRMMTVSLRNDDYLGATRAALAEVERAARFGFLASEFARQKTVSIRSLEQMYLERENVQSSSLAGMYVAHFLNGTPVRAIASQVAANRELINSITLEDVNTAVKYGFPTRGRMISLILPEAKDGAAAPPSSETLLSLIDDMRTQQLSGYAEVASDASVLASLAPPGTVTSERSYPELGVTEWMLSNGARVLLKPTDLRSDEVVLSAVSPGGLYMLADSDVVAGQLINTVVGLSGYGNLDQEQLKRRLAGKLMVIRKNVDNGSESISGRSSPQDLESFFEGLYAMWTQPRYDSTLVASALQNARSTLEGGKSDPNRAFSDTIFLTTVQHSPRHPLMTVEMLDKIDPRRPIQLYRERFASASDFTIVIVGSFTLDQIKPLVLRYLSSLPAGPKDEVPDRGVHAPTGIVKKVIYGGREPKSHSIVTYHGECHADPSLDIRARMTQLQMLAEIAKHRLHVRLREELSGTYGVSGSANLSLKPRCRFNLSTEFITAPERREEITQAFFAVMDTLRLSGPTAEEIERVRSAMLRNREMGLQSNEFWMQQMIQNLQLGWPLEQILDQSVLETITPAELHKAAQRYLPKDNYMHFVLDPETVKP